jgi:D-alanyl-D-alanine carboxypeptidase
MLYLIAAVSMLAAGPLTAETHAPTELAAFVESVAGSAIEKDGVVGMSIGVARHDQVLYRGGFGMANAELQVPASADTVYRIGSITKEFTAAGVLLLVQEGKISLDDPLEKFLPEYPVKGREITVRHLLQHTSGIQDFTRLPAYRENIRIDASQDDVLDRFQHLPLEFEPGDKHRYSNSGFFLLGVILEKTAGKPFEDFVQQRLLGPLGLERTYCDHPTRIIPNRASGYTRWDDVLRNAPYVSLDQATGAGNMASTVGDLLAWQQAIAQHCLLNAETTRDMMTRGKLNNGATFDYGMALFLKKQDEHQVIRHGGGILGFRADLAYYPASGYMIAVLANSENAKAARVSNQIARFLLASDTDG